jgi:RNA polymerase sigma-70 factor (ECF subfamily)
MPDDFVLNRIAAGDADAVQECIDLYGNLVWTIARRFTRSAADTEDAVQDVFIDLWKSAGRFDPARATEAAFVAMVARRRLIDHVRRSERRPQTTEIPDNFEIPGTDAHHVEMSADAALAARALQQIKPEQRDVLMMSFYHGMTHAEIVEETGLPLGTVKSHIRRGLGEVRRILGDPGSPTMAEVP